jgi:hypothetical protein
MVESAGYPAINLTFSIWLASQASSSFHIFLHDNNIYGPRPSPPEQEVDLHYFHDNKPAPHFCRIYHHIMLQVEPHA